MRDQVLWKVEFEGNDTGGEGEHPLSREAGGKAARMAKNGTEEQTMEAD
jgi:hypothetical protein